MRAAAYSAAPGANAIGLCTAYYDSPLGRMLLAARGDALTGAWFVGQKYFPALDAEVRCETHNAEARREMPDADARCEALGAEAGRGMPDAPVLVQAKDWLDRYFAGEAPPPFAGKLAPEGSEFRQTVFVLLREIPYGCVTTYGRLAEEIARRYGKERVSARSVGGAVGHNPISVIIPCHRVVAADGALTGYAGGTEKKRGLLALEGVRFSRNFERCMLQCERQY